MDFEFPAEVTDQTVIPESFRGLYKPADGGKFKLDSENASVKGAVEAVRGLNQALKSERAVTKELKGKVKDTDLTPLKEFGETPEAVAAAVKAKLDEAQAAKPNVEKIKQDLASHYQQQIKDKDARVGGLTKQLHRLLVVNDAAKHLAAEEAVDPELAMPFVETQVKVVEENGEVSVRVVDTTGQERYSGVTGKHMTVAELVKEMKGTKKFQPLFKSAALSGGGTRNPGRGTAAPVDGGKMSANQKIAAGLGKRR